MISNGTLFTQLSIHCKFVKFSQPSSIETFAQHEIKPECKSTFSLLNIHLGSKMSNFYWEKWIP